MNPLQNIITVLYFFRRLNLPNFKILEWFLVITIS